MTTKSPVNTHCIYTYVHTKDSGRCMRPNETDIDGFNANTITNNTLSQKRVRIYYSE